MPSASTIAISDSTPTSHDFGPRGENGSAFVFKNTEAATGAGQMSLALSLSDASPSRPTHKALITIAVPVEQTVDGVTTVAYTLRFKGEFIIPEEATATQRADLLAYASNALAHADVKGYVEDLEPVW